MMKRWLPIIGLFFALLPSYGYIITNNCDDNIHVWIHSDTTSDILHEFAIPAFDSRMRDMGETQMTNAPVQVVIGIIVGYTRYGAIFSWANVALDNWDQIITVNWVDKKINVVVTNP